ncbi:unnamed protein product [Strongylus vulgaris]|uniref:Uncharacterized protein n=1 Tax=Strongylus vulgaris TaxID=40348 RepID=A0A3P7J3T1_STRVU|nr:unnamed protein product [Strongylus vulgaris]
MSRVILFLTLIAFAFAVPPIVPKNMELKRSKKFKPIVLEPVSKEELDILRPEKPSGDKAPCVDGVNNVIELADTKEALAIRTSGLTLQTYDVEGYPSCREGRAMISLPGMIKLAKGKRDLVKTVFRKFPPSK